MDYKLTLKQKYGRIISEQASASGLCRAIVEFAEREIKNGDIDGALLSLAKIRRKLETTDDAIENIIAAELAE